MRARRSVWRRERDVGTTAVVSSSASPRSPTSRRKARKLSPFPKIVIAGTLSPGGAVFRQVVRGCPFRQRSYRMRRRKLRVRERNFRAGTVIELRVVKRGRVAGTRGYGSGGDEGRHASIAA